MIDAPVAVAFAAGMVAAFNPCGFAMLPAYLSWFLGSEGSPAGPPSDTAGSVGRAVTVALAVSAGFVAVFGVAGVLVTQASLSVQEYAPWITIPIGLALIPLGAAMATGWEPKLPFTFDARGAKGTTVPSMALFGVSYAVVSLSCTLPVFLAAVSGTFERSTFVSGMAVFGAYSGGMALVLTVLTVSLGLARHSMVRNLRRVLPYVNRAAGVLLMIAGAYVAWYGWYEIRTLDGEQVAAGPVDWVTSWSAEVQTWVQDVGPTRLGLIAVLALGSVVAGAYAAREARRPGGPASPVDADAASLDRSH